MSEQTNQGFSPSSNKASAQPLSSSQAGGMLEHMAHEGCRAAFAEGLHELHRLHNYPCQDAINRAAQCFIQAAYSCESGEQWSLVLGAACDALRSHRSSMDGDLESSLDGAVEMLAELRDEFGDVASQTSRPLPT